VAVKIGRAALVRPRGSAHDPRWGELADRKVERVRRLFVLVVTPWIVLCLHGTVRAHAAAYPDPTPPPTVQVLPANAAATPATHGVTQPHSTLPFTGADAVVLLGFAGAVLVPGVGLLVVSRRNRHTVRPV
jgi:hypothetical protein